MKRVVIRCCRFGLTGTGVDYRWRNVRGNPYCFAAVLNSEDRSVGRLQNNACAAWAIIDFAAAPISLGRVAGAHDATNRLQCSREVLVAPRTASRSGYGESHPEYRRSSRN